MNHASRTDGSLMARETKVGLLIGLGMILLVGIIISDHLAQMENQAARGELTRFAEHTQQSINGDGSAKGAEQRVIRTPTELRQPNQRAKRRTRDAAQGEQNKGDALPPSQAMQPDAADQASNQNRTSRPPAARGERSNQAAISNQPTSASSTNESPEPTSFRLDLSGEQRPVEQQSEATANPRNSSESDETSPATDKLKHTVKSDQSLFEIAKRYYDNGSYWKSITRANPEKTTEEGQVREGVTLVIPNRAGRVIRRGDGSESGEGRGQSSDISRMRQVVQAAESRTITVRDNDTLSRLASQYLDDKSRWRAFLKYNSGKLDDPNDIRPGMTLKLPPMSNDSPGRSTTAQTGQAAGQTERGARTYTIQPEDNLYRIAQQKLGNGNAWRKIYNANKDKLASPDDLTVGETIRIPAE